MMEVLIFAALALGLLAIVYAALRSQLSRLREYEDRDAAATEAHDHSHSVEWRPVTRTLDERDHGAAQQITFRARPLTQEDLDELREQPTRPAFRPSSLNNTRGGVQPPRREATQARRDDTGFDGFSSGMAVGYVMAGDDGTSEVVVPSQAPLATDGRDSRVPLSSLPDSPPAKPSTESLPDLTVIPHTQDYTPSPGFSAAPVYEAPRYEPSRHDTTPSYRSDHSPSVSEPPSYSGGYSGGGDSGFGGGGGGDFGGSSGD